MTTESTRILGTGVDIVETARIQDSLDKFGERFLNRCFWPERSGLLQRHEISRAPFRGPVRGERSDFESVRHRHRSSARLEGHGDLQTRQRRTVRGTAWQRRGPGPARGVTEVFVSLTHSKDYAAAQAVIVGHAPSTSAKQ